MPKQISSVLINGGQGDCVMGAIGLDAMLTLAPQAFAPDLTVYTRTYIAPVIQALLPQLPVKLLDEARQAQRPKYYPSSHFSGSTVLRNLFGQDYYVNYAASRERASFGAGAPSVSQKVLHALTDFSLYRRFSWRAYSPTYYGLMMWLPLALAHGHTGIDLLRQLHRNFPAVGQRLAASLENGSSVSENQVAFFPVGRAYQTQPPAFVHKVVEAMGLTDYCCYFPDHEPRRQAYEALGLRCASANAPMTMLNIMATAAATITSDSLSSHLGQLVARRHVALMSHDVPTHTVHPAAESAVVFRAMPCVPCVYTGMSDSPSCSAGLSQCGVFDEPAYFAKIQAVLASILGQN